jgi:hypothetical protein
LGKVDADAVSFAPRIATIGAAPAIVGLRSVALACITYSVTECKWRVFSMG